MRATISVVGLPPDSFIESAPKVGHSYAGPRGSHSWIGLTEVPINFRRISWSSYWLAIARFPSSGGSCYKGFARSTRIRSGATFLLSDGIGVPVLRAQEYPDLWSNLRGGRSPFLDISALSIWPFLLSRLSRKMILLLSGIQQWTWLSLQAKPSLRTCIYFLALSESSRSISDQDTY